MSEADPNDPSNGYEDEPPRESVLSIVLSLALLIFIVFAFKQSILDANNIPSGSMIPTLLVGDYLFVNKMRYSLRIPWTRIRLFDYDDPRRGDIVTFEPPSRGSQDFVKRVIGMPGDRIRIKSIPACQLGQYARKAGFSRTRRDALADAWGFTCKPTDRRVPYLSFVEYKPADKGPWRNFSVRLAPVKTRQLLTDADDPDMLHPNQRPRPLAEQEGLPVVFQATVNGRTHLTVEKSTHYISGGAVCQQLDHPEGCVIPRGRYLVMGDNRDHSQDSRMIGTIPRADIRGKVLIIYFSINWRDQICSRSAPGPGNHGHRFLIKDFPPKDQARLCTMADQQLKGEKVRTYLTRTLRYRVRRMRVRWRRMFSLPI